MWKSRKLYFSSEKKVFSDTRHALKPFQPSNKHFSVVKRGENVKFAQNFFKLLLWFLSSIFLLFMIHNHGNLLVALDWLLLSITFCRYCFFSLRTHFKHKIVNRNEEKTKCTPAYTVTIFTLSRFDYLGVKQTPGNLSVTIIMAVSRLSLEG